MHAIHAEVMSCMLPASLTAAGNSLQDSTIHKRKSYKTLQSLLENDELLF